MTISYNWLCDYLAEKIEPEKLSRILTAIGLEVESMEPFEEITGNLVGLVVGEVLECEKHPDADKLSLTKVDIGAGEPLQIVCGAANVAKGQKVIVATIGTTIYPLTGEPVTMKKAKIRGVESMGMICAEDEIGIGQSHEGIIVLPAETLTGTPAAEYFDTYKDTIFEIGLTPNRMDAMSHLGVARDVCAYLTHHNKKDTAPKLPYKNAFKADNHDLPIAVVIENEDACQRYAGVSISGVTIAESPKWLQQKLKSIGLRPISNIVDITNFILHETGQPLHAFDADKIAGKQVLVKNLPAGTAFTTLDEKERKLSAEDLMICDGNSAPMCIGGVFGGLNSGISNETKNIFLESAWFSPVSIRRSSLRHGLRTDAATRFEKGVDISNCVNVLKRAALMIQEIAGGTIASDIVDVYPAPKAKKEVGLKFHYLKKLSGKSYHPDTAKKILHALGFELIKENVDELWVAVPFSKTDISIPADVVEEIMRIDGLDNVEIPSGIYISPAVETLAHEAGFKEKTANYLTGLGFNEIFTNSITNSAYFNEEVLATAVKMINNLSVELDVMRPSLLHTGLESVAYNLNRRNNNLHLFEFGKTYSVSPKGEYKEQDKLAIFISGNKKEDGWQQKSGKADFFYLKGICEKLFALLSVRVSGYEKGEGQMIVAKVKQDIVAQIGEVDAKTLAQFDIKQSVFFADFDWNKLLALNKKSKIVYQEIPKYPAVQRDLAIVVDKGLGYGQVEKATAAAGVNKLTSLDLFDIFESDKIGAGKKSMAVSFTFLDEEKTLTDKEIDSMMNKIISAYEKELNAEVRK